MTDEFDRNDEAVGYVSVAVLGCLVLLMVAAAAGLVVLAVGVVRG